MAIAGVDEAGRGPVLGPLVVAAVLVDDEAPLVGLEVKDSKALSPARREALAPAIRAVATGVAVRSIAPAELDERMQNASLNRIEEEAFAQVLTELGASRAVVDACDVDAARFGAHVASRIEQACTVVSEHKADARHPVVAAASVIAKVTRDAAVRDLAAEFGPVGSGYASDPATQRFLKAYIEEHGEPPSCARRRWDTVARLLPTNRSLLEFEG